MGGGESAGMSAETVGGGLVTAAGAGVSQSEVGLTVTVNWVSTAPRYKTLVLVQHLF